jgi:hypothetical protein
MFGPAYMGRKRIFQLLSLHCARILPLGLGPFVLVTEALEVAAPHLFRPMYAEANMGHPSCYFGFAVGSTVAGERLWYPTSREKRARCGAPRLLTELALMGLRTISSGHVR